MNLNEHTVMKRIQCVSYYEKYYRKIILSPSLIFIINLWLSNSILYRNSSIYMLYFFFKLYINPVNSNTRI